MEPLEIAWIDGVKWCSAKGDLCAWRITGPPWVLWFLWQLHRRNWRGPSGPVRFLTNLMGARIEYADKKHMPPNNRRFADHVRHIISASGVEDKTAQGLVGLVEGRS